MNNLCNSSDGGKIGAEAGVKLAYKSGFLISALRYESAVELTERLNREQKGESTLTTMFGGIPSYMDLGMALLLPHQTLNITENGVFLVDGIVTQGTESRTKVLRAAKPESIAITYESISGMNKQQMSKAFAGIKLIYIHHNAIDAEGDKASTEHKVFHATEEAFKELSGLERVWKRNILGDETYERRDK